jgi:hypothetical protein
MEKSGELISRIREFINRPRKQNLLLKDKRFWNQLTSSLDVVQDTDLALDDYAKDDFPESTGQRYLAIYGVLQCLFVQQYAVDHLIESLKLKIPNTSERLKDVRDVRNKSIGHPTKKSGKKGATYHFISRVTMHKEGFQLMSCVPERGHEFENVDILRLISRQRGVIEEVLKEVLAMLEEEEMKHKEEFKAEKLANIFQKNIGYSIGKMYEAIHGGMSGPLFVLGLGHLEQIEKALESFKQALQRRGLWEPSEGIRYTYKEMEYPISELEKYLQRKDGSESPGEKANVNLFFVEKKIEELKGVAKEIDEDYEE